MGEEEDVGVTYSARIVVSTSVRVDPREAARAAARASRSGSMPLTTSLGSAGSSTRRRLRRVNTRGKRG